MTTRYPGTRYKVSHKHTHADRLERWLGKEACERVSASMRNWYGPPIAVAGVPGDVFACGGGEFVGRIDAGQECSWMDRARESWKRWVRYHTIAGRYSPAQMNAFTSLSQIVNSINGGKSTTAVFNKTAGTATSTSFSSDLWMLGPFPAGGASGAAAPGGTATTGSTSGSWLNKNPVNADTWHIEALTVKDSQATPKQRTLMVIDQLFRVAKTMNSTATEAVTGTFSRYQSGTSTAEDYIGGNFCFPSIGSSLAATAHNWTVCQYTDQDSNTAQSFPSVTGTSTGEPQTIIDLAAGPGSWFIPLASGDVGVKALTQMQCSALVATGTLNFVVAHPLMIVPVCAIHTIMVADGLRTAMEFTRIYNNACLSGLSICNSVADGGQLNGLLVLVSE